jgi:hypothetical protein
VEVVRELDEAVAYCSFDSSKAEYALVKAIAYYGGSLVTQVDSDGVLLDAKHARIFGRTRFVSVSKDRRE